MQTNPEQWAVELWHLAHRAYVLDAKSRGHGVGVKHAATLIQAAFAEREARLVGALEQIATVDMGGGFLGAQACRKVALAALKDRTHG